MSTNTKTTDDYAPEDTLEYNQKLRGLFGEFGAGNHTKVCFLQTGIKSADLNKLTLVGELSGSEKWPVRDLFQREVDTHRVTHGIIPYIENVDKIKFFPPLTLTILPVCEDAARIVTELAEVPEKEITLEGRLWMSYEVPGCYRFRFIKGQQHNGLVEWDDKKVRVVAIDGQHRLSALKRIVKRPGDDAARAGLLEWTIPVVILGLRGMSHHTKGNVLNHIRNIFVVINTTAKAPNTARTILLSEESINSICVQELLQTSHENDVKELSHRDAAKIPLLFYDWRGEEDRGKPIPSESSIKSSEEIENTLATYIMGGRRQDFSPQQKDALGVIPTDSLQKVFQKGRLEPSQTESVREAFKKSLLPGLEHLISEFAPYKQYIAFLWSLESKYISGSDSAKYAFYKLRFGVHGVTEEKSANDIKEVHDEIVHEIVKAKSRLPDLIARDIGFRGIVSAFGKLRSYHKLEHQTSVAWITFAQWFTDALNLAYADHWLDGKDTKKHQRLLHIAHNERQDVVNYKYDDVDNALGIFVTLLVAHYGKMEKKTRDKLWNTYSENLLSTLITGYRKQCFTEVSQKHSEWTRKQKSDAARKAAEPLAEKHLADLETLLGGSAASANGAEKTKKKKSKK